MRRVAAIAAVLALGLCAQAQGSGLLTTQQAKNAMRHFSLTNGMERAEVRRCSRLDPDRVRCQMVETGWWNDEGLWAKEVWSVYIAHREPGEVSVTWEDFVLDSGNAG